MHRNAAKRRAEKKAEEEKAAERRAEKKIAEEARTETGEYTVSATGKPRTTSPGMAPPTVG